jgi:sugar/nucleoside kinase (ribokinase family)
VDAERAELVDSTGAGDAFAAGFLPAWLAGTNPSHALRDGHLLATQAVRILGGRPPS